MQLTPLKKLLTSLSLAGLLAGITAETQAAFSISASKSAGGTLTHYTVDTDAGLVFKVRAYDNKSSTQSAGDIQSLIYNGVEYTSQSRGTQINSGFDWIWTVPVAISAVDVKAELIDANGNATPVTIPSAGQTTTDYASDFIKFTITSNAPATATSVQKTLTHYYIVKRGEANIYMGTHFTAEPEGQALVRFIARVPAGALPNGTPAGNNPTSLTSYGTWAYDNRGTNVTTESGDVFGFNSGTYAGETRSKHYANKRLKDWSYIGGTGPNVGMYIVRGNNEGNSGGPFYRSLSAQLGGENELTYIVNYGEAQTEPYRFNILNDYTLMFTNGSEPAPVDNSWFSKMNLLGYVAPENRGAVSVSTITGRDPKFAYTVGFSNATAQYWADVNPATGTATSTGMIPGTYTMKVYKNELAVNTSTVTVGAGETTTTAPISVTVDPLAASTRSFYTNLGDPSLTPALFRIGEWDGTPTEFINGDKLTIMHPSDVRMSSWNPPAYNVGSSTPKTGFPAYQWKGINNPITVNFKLKASQVSAASTYRVRVGITTAYANARPQIKVNGWASGWTAQTPQPSTRTLTVGTYRGNNYTFSFTVPADKLIAGNNVLTLEPVSGSGFPTGYLTAGYSIDAVDLIKTP